MSFSLKGKAISFDGRGSAGNIEMSFASITFADLFNKGRPDILKTVGLRGLFLHRNVTEQHDAPLFDKAVRLDGNYGLPGIGDYYAALANCLGSGLKATDFNGDGLCDLIAAGPGEIRLFMNTGTPDLPCFAPVRRFAVGGINEQIRSVEAVDWDGNGVTDILAGTVDYRNYFVKEHIHREGDHPVYPGKYTADGKWRGGQMQGGVYFLRNAGTNNEPRFEAPRRLCTKSGMPLICNGGIDVLDLDNAGSKYLVCARRETGVMCYRQNDRGELDEGIPFIELVPFVEGLKHKSMFWTVTLWTVDLLGEGVRHLVIKDGYSLYYSRRVADRGRFHSYADPVKIRQLDPDLWVENFAVPVACDWDGDGDLDLIVGDEAGYVWYFENYGDRGNPRFKEGIKMEAGGEEIHIQAGLTGSPQGPCEADWGYTQPAVADWDGDGLLDLIVSDIRGEYTFYRNIGAKTKPRLAEGEKIEVDGKKLVTVWRVRPGVIDWNGDGLTDLITLGPDSYLTYYERYRDGDQLKLKSGVKLRYADGALIKLDGSFTAEHCHNGRIKLSIVDLDGDGNYDIVYGTSGMAEDDVPEEKMFYYSRIMVLRNRGTNANPVFSRPEPVLLENGQPANMGWHTAAPCVVDWDGDGKLDLIAGCEDGKIYYFHNSGLASAEEAGIWSEKEHGQEDIPPDIKDRKGIKIVFGIRNSAESGLIPARVEEHVRTMAKDVGAEISLRASSRWCVCRYGLKPGRDSVIICRLHGAGRAMTDLEKLSDKIIAEVIDNIDQCHVKAFHRHGYDQATFLREQRYECGGDCAVLDIRGQVNMGFADEEADDRRGGLFDEGRSLVDMPLGDNKFCGVPFHVIDPAGNGGASCIVLRGGAKPYFPAEAKGIRVERKASNLYVLHTAGSCDSSGGELVYRLRLNYTDGSEGVLEIKAGREIKDWFNSKPEENFFLPRARIAWQGKARGKAVRNGEEFEVGIYCARLANPIPEKEIRTLDLLSGGGMAVPAILAITAEENR